MSITTLNLYESLLKHDRPVAWWGLDTADPTVDDSGHGYTLTANSAPANAASLLTRGDAGAAGSRDFDGTDDAYYTLGTLYASPEAPPAYHAGTAAAGSTSVTSIISPNGIEAGDLVLACLVHSSQTATISAAPAGWTQVGSTLNASTCAVAVYKRLPGSDEPAAQYQWTWSASGTTLATMLVYRNCDQSVSGLIYDSGQQGTSSSAFHSTTTETHPIQSHALVFWCGDFAGSITPDPTGLKTRANVSTGNVRIVAAEYDQAASGSATKTAETSAATQLGAILLTFGAPNEVRENALDTISSAFSAHAIIRPDSATGGRTIITQDSAWLFRVAEGVLEYWYHDGVTYHVARGPWVSASETAHVVAVDDGESFIKLYKNGVPTNLVSDGSFESGFTPGNAQSMWEKDAGTLTVNSDATDVVHPTTGGYRCYTSSRTDSALIAGREYIPVDVSKPYVLSHYVRQWQQLGSVDPNGTIRLACYDGNKTYLGFTYPNETAPGVNYDSGHAITYTGSFARWGGRYRGESGVDGTNVGGFLPGTKYVRISCLLQYTATAFSAGIGVVIDAIDLVQGETPFTWSNGDRNLHTIPRQTTTNIVPQPGNNITIGGRYTTGWTEHFDGRIDEVAVWNTAVTPAMVAAWYEAYSAGTFGTQLAGSANYPRAKLEIAWASNPTDDCLAWENVTADWRGTLSCTRGRNVELDRIESGRMDFTLDNRRRQYDDTYVSSPYYPNVKPTRAVRLRAQAATDGVVYPVFFGYTEGHPLVRLEMGKDSVAQFTAIDAFKALALDKVLGSFVRPQESTGERLQALLDGFPGIPYSGATGQTLIVGDDLDGANSLDHAQQVAETEAGVFFASREGIVTFQDRHYRVVNERTVRATYGDGGGAELPVKDMQPQTDESRLFTAAAVTPASGNVQRSIDPSGSIAHFVRTKELATLGALDNDAAAMAEGFAYRYATPRTRIPSLALQPVMHSSPATMWATVLDHEISHRIKSVERPIGSTSAVSREHFIEGIRHDISPSDWHVSLSVSPAELEGEFWLLGTGELGDTSGLTSTVLGW